MFTYTKPKETKGDIETPIRVAEYLHQLLKKFKPKVVLDPCCGHGNLLRPWFSSCYTTGIDIDPTASGADTISIGPFESPTTSIGPYYPDLILCNPPWNRHWKAENYAEVFFRRILELFPGVPLVMLVPMGFRLNQRMNSSRRTWFKNRGPEISSIISCPLDMYEGVQFHNEILIFNVKRIKPHYWIEL